MGQSPSLPLQRGDGGISSPATLILWLALALLLALSAAVRFYKLNIIGLEQGDCLIYWLETTRWNMGIFTNHWAKPGYHLLGLLAFRLFGPHDYTLPYLNCFLDVINVALVFIVAKRAGASNSAGMSAALAYAFMPYMILSGRHGFVEIPSATFLLFSFWMLLEYLRARGKIAYLILCGLAVGYAGSVHPTLLCIPGFYCAIILASSLKRPVLKTLSAMCLRQAVFLASFAVVFIGLALLLQISSGEPSLVSVIRRDMIGRLFSHWEGAVIGRSGGFIGKFSYYLTEIAPITSWPTFAFMCATGGAFLVFSVVALLRKKAGRNERQISGEVRNLGLVWGLVLFFMVVNSAIVKATSRMPLIQMVSFIILGSFLTIEFFLRKLRIPRAGAILIGMSLLLIILNFGTNRKFLHDLTTPSVYRQVADALGDKLDERNQLLITPSSFYWVYDGFKHYLPGYYHPIPRDWDPGLLSPKLKELRIRYILVSRTFLDPRTYHLLYSQGQEYGLIRQGINERNGKLTYESDEIAIYEIPGGS